MYKLPLLTGVIVSLSLTPSTSVATDRNPLYSVANNYRNAVVNFERVVVRTRGIQRIDEKAVDRFEEATKQLRLAARNPSHANRLRYQWRDVRTLQYQIEAIIFGKYTLNRDLAVAWQDVLIAEVIFNDEYVHQVENPRHGNSVQLRANSARVNRLLSPPPASGIRLYPFQPSATR